jgi:hypothetical protein
MAVGTEPSAAVLTGDVGVSPFSGTERNFVNVHGISIGTAFSWKQENPAILNANQTCLVLHKQTTNPCHISPKQTSNYKI